MAEFLRGSPTYEKVSKADYGIGRKYLLTAQRTARIKSFAHHLKSCKRSNIKYSLEREEAAGGGGGGGGAGERAGVADREREEGEEEMREERT